jgi:hypothetical protein
MFVRPCEICNTSTDLRFKIEQRINEKFFEFIYSNALTSFTIDELLLSIKNVLVTWYKNALKYLDDTLIFRKIIIWQ